MYVTVSTIYLGKSLNASNPMSNASTQKGGKCQNIQVGTIMDATTKTFHGIKVAGSTTTLLIVPQGQQNNSIMLTQHDYKHHHIIIRIIFHEGFAEAPYRLHEAFSKTRSAKASWSPREAFVKPSWLVRYLITSPHNFQHRVLRID